MYQFMHLTRRHPACHNRSAGRTTECFTPMIWLHIGTKKTGTTALQHYFSRHAGTLQKNGLTYISPRQKSSCNTLAIAMNRGRVAECESIGAYLSQQLDDCPTENAILSSEMLYGIAPEKIFDAVPALRQQPISVLVYLRRQDQYLESGYLQKLKNGRFRGSIHDYLERFEGSGADYWENLSSWRDCEQATLVPRVCEPDKLTGGTVVADACALLGMPAPEAEDQAVNVSPSVARVQLLQLLADMPGLRLRAIQRTLSRDHPDESSNKAVFLSREERARILQQYADGNEKLRALFFPQMRQIFGTEGLDADPDTRDDTSFSDAQLAQIKALLNALHKIHLK